MIVGGFAGLTLIAHGIDTFIDFIYHAGIPAVFIAGAAALRSLHRGRSDYYLALYVYFAAMVLLIIYLVWG